MKKILLILVAAVMAMSANAQETVKKMRVYDGNSIVFEREYSNVDSIVFVDEIIIPDVPELPTGALSGEFSVSATKKVHFSQGNLQAFTADLGANWTWGFAAHQYDVIGNAAANNAINGNGTVSANGIVDLFGWSTAATYYGIHNSTDNNTYSGDFVDWGATIGEGWYTLSKDEWYYIFYTRTNAASLFGLGSVNGVNGTIILPDNWVTLDGASFTPSKTQGLADQGGYYNNSNGDNFSHNTYTAEQWSVMESAGAVFLPTASYRSDTDVRAVGSDAYYCSSTLFDEDFAYNVYFNSNFFYPQDHDHRYYGHAVRLVKDVTPVDPDSIPEEPDSEPTSDPAGVNIPAGTINVNEAVDICKDLNNSEVTQDRYFIKGWVVGFNRRETFDTDFPRYGNDFVYIKARQDGQGSKQFYAYRVVGKFGAKLPDLECVKEGDFVVICCYMTNYNSSYESNGLCYIYSSSNEHFNDVFPDFPGCPEPGEGEISVTDAEKISASLASKETSTETCRIRGVVTSVDTDFNQAYGNLTFNISDGTGVATCYRLKGKNNSKFTNANQIQVGDTVLVNAKIQNYNYICEPTQGYVEESTNPNFQAYHTQAFTVNAEGKQVYFSQGNLQYQASTQTWRFAENQYDTIGFNNRNISDTYDGWIDLFGWGTGDNPTNTSTDYSDYSTFVDWGVNTITNDGNEAGNWRTLTYEEWEYIFNGRYLAQNLRSQATVCGVQGYVLLPDAFIRPNGLSWSPRANDWGANTYDAQAWSTMEAKGAIFLPAAGQRSGTSSDSVGSNGCYWSASYYDQNGAWYMAFYSGDAIVSADYRNIGKSVRLVKDVE